MINLYLLMVDLNYRVAVKIKPITQKKYQLRALRGVTVSGDDCKQFHTCRAFLGYLLGRQFPSNPSDFLLF